MASFLLDIGVGVAGIVEGQCIEAWEIACPFKYLRSCNFSKQIQALIEIISICDHSKKIDMSKRKSSQDCMELDNYPDGW